MRYPLLELATVPTLSGRGQVLTGSQYRSGHARFRIVWDAGGLVRGANGHATLIGGSLRATGCQESGRAQARALRSFGGPIWG